MDISHETNFKLKAELVIPYFFQKEQLLKIEFDYPSKNFTKNSIANIGTIITSHQSTYSINLPHFDFCITAIPPDNNESSIEIDINIIHNKPIGKELFYLISNTHNPKDFTRVFKSEELFPGNSNDWNFSKISLPKSYLFFDDNQKILLQIMEFDEYHIKITEKYRTMFTLNEVRSPYREPIQTNEIKASLHIVFKEYKLLNFVDYISKGMKLNLITAIDYTGSNGHPMDETSLHYIKAKEPTQYEKAICACGNILAPYDEDQMFPIYGFGGVPPGKMLVEHVFSLAPFVDKNVRVSNKKLTKKTNTETKKKMKQSKTQKEKEENIKNYLSNFHNILNVNPDTHDSLAQKKTGVPESNLVSKTNTQVQFNNNNKSNKGSSNNLKYNQNILKYVEERKVSSFDIENQPVQSIESQVSNSSLSSDEKSEDSNRINKFKQEDEILFEEDAVYGLDGVIQAYKNSLTKIIFSGPTNFSPLIEKVKNTIKANLRSESMDYFILLIITDGQISDLKHSINSIVNASELPLSIVIVGVGNEDFTSMNELDGDEFPLTNYNNKVTARDIVQFVPFNEYKDNIKLLGQEILREVPLQVESYFHFSSNNLKFSKN